MPPLRTRNKERAEEINSNALETFINEQCFPVVGELVECFGEQRDLRTIDETAAEDFKLFLLPANLASTAIAKRLQFVRQFFRAAVKRKPIPSNPLAEVGGKAILNSDRERFITREETDRLLSACPNIDWRVIVALCRFGGLRCPTEVLTFKWADVDWEPGGWRNCDLQTQFNRIHHLVPETAFAATGSKCTPRPTT